MEAIDGPTEATARPAVSSTAYFMKVAAWSDEPRATVTTKFGSRSRRPRPASASTLADPSSKRAVACGISSISRRIWGGADRLGIGKHARRNRGTLDRQRRVVGDAQARQARHQLAR